MATTRAVVHAAAMMVRRISQRIRRAPVAVATTLTQTRQRLQQMQPLIARVLAQERFSNTFITVVAASTVSLFVVHAADRVHVAQRMTRSLFGVNTQWTFIGPQPLQREYDFGGWMTALAVDPRDPSVAYAGAAGGGVWKTTNGGQLWIPLTDNQPSLSVGSLAIDPSAPDVVYVGTGFLENATPNLYYGVGVLKSTNGGATWSHLAGPFAQPLTIEQGGAQVISLAVHPTKGQILLAGVRAGGAVASGVYRSNDAGNSWTNVLTGGTGRSVLFDPSNGDVAYAAVAMGSRNGVFKSIDGGATWRATGTGSNVVPTDVDMMSLAIAPSVPTTLYVGIASASFGSANFPGSIFKTTDGGQNWIRLSNAPNFCGAACWRRYVVRVHPTNPDVVFAGGRIAGNNLYRTLDGGGSWTEVSLGVGGLQLFADLSALAFSRDGATLYVANDGGVFKTTDSLAPPPMKWENLNRTLAATEFSQGLAFHPTDPSIGFGGPEEGGVARFTGTTVWQGGIVCGDGGRVVVDPLNPNNVYATCQPDATAIYKSTNGGQRGQNSWQLAQDGVDTADRSAQFRPLTMDPSNPQRLYFGTYRVYQTNNRAASWIAISGDLMGGQSAVSAIAVAPTNPNMIYVGTAAVGYRGPSPTAVPGAVLVTTNADAGRGAAWINRSAGLPPRAVTQIVVDPANALTAYVAYAGFSGFSDNKGHIFKTTNGGVDWNDISGNLPNIRVNDVVLDPGLSDTLYIATDVGVLRTVDGGAIWSSAADGLPNVVVMGLKLHRSSRTLRAATYGRGVWDLQVPKSRGAFTDDPLVAGVSVVRAVHITELRSRIDGVRLRYGLTSYGWTDSTLTAGVTMVLAIHISDLRTALAEAYTAAGLSPPTYTDPALGPRTSIRAAHVGELRAAVIAIE